MTSTAAFPGSPGLGRAEQRGSSGGVGTAPAWSHRGAPQPPQDGTEQLRQHIESLMYENSALRAAADEQLRHGNPQLPASMGSDLRRQFGEQQLPTSLPHPQGSAPVLGSDPRQQLAAMHEALQQSRETIARLQHQLHERTQQLRQEMALRQQQLREQSSSLLQRMQQQCATVEAEREELAFDLQSLLETSTVRGVNQRLAVLRRKYSVENHVFAAETDSVYSEQQLSDWLALEDEAARLYEVFSDVDDRRTRDMDALLAIADHLIPPSDEAKGRLRSRLVGLKPAARASSALTEATDRVLLLEEELDEQRRKRKDLEEAVAALHERLDSAPGTSEAERTPDVLNLLNSRNSLLETQNRLLRVKNHQLTQALVKLGVTLAQ